MNYRVAVRTLCEFTAKQGDLDLRFTPAPSALEGMAGHTLVQGRRGPTYRAEIALSANYHHLSVSGRADGYDPEQHQLEEIKTHRGNLDLMPANQRALHWAQLRLYGHLFLQTPEAQENDALRLALVYFDIDSQQETVFFEHHTPETLRHYFEQQCHCFLAFAEQELAQRSERNQALETLSFPFPEFRHGQRELAAAVYNAHRKGCCLLAQAPTGIGKTIGTLFPTLKACPTQKIDKIFFLSAKTAGRQLALHALQPLLQTIPQLRVLELVARDKACEHPELACHGASCPLAKGFYDRLPAARQAALIHTTSPLDQTRLRTIALEHQICPYYLSQEMARWCDVIIGDYNYYFDITAMLYGLTRLHQWRVSLLVDEAHNLLQRGRSMYSAELQKSRWQQAKRLLSPALKKSFNTVLRQWRTLPSTGPYQALPEPPAPMLQALQQATHAITEHMVLHPNTLPPEVQQCYFDALHFCHVAELYDEHSLCDISHLPHDEKHPVLSLRNLIPAPFLRQRFAASHAATLFSATLSPCAFYQDTLGLPENSHWVDIDAPFHHSQLALRVVRHISTRYPHRQRSLRPIVQIMAQQYQQQTGNYLAFFSSFEYLEQALQCLQEQHPEIPCHTQTRRMDENQRKQFLAHFVPEGQGIGFAVLGGNFGEAIDLPGTRLIGAFIATLGLPQLNPVNEQLRQKMETRFGQGYAYTYLYPGLQKVVQAAGRVIRTPSDQGTVYLIDDRFTRPEVQALFPAWWQIDYSDKPPANTPSKI